MIGNAQVLFMANIILAVMYYLVCAFVCVCMGICIKHMVFLGIL